MLINDIKELRSKLHENPEKSFSESKTKSILMDYIKTHSDFNIVDKGQWFYCYRLANGNPIGFRCDMDAVSLSDDNIGHYCGHDGHCAIICGLAQYLTDKKLDRDVYLIFQPAEEIGQGAKICCELIEEKQIQEMYGLHNIPGYKEREILLKRDTFACGSVGMSINYLGKAVHAAFSERGINPTYGFNKLVTELNSITDDLKENDEILMLTYIGLIIGSDNFGSSAYKGRLNITVRGQDSNKFEKLIKLIEQKAYEIAEIEKLDCQINKYDYFPATINDNKCIEKIEKQCQKLNLNYRYLDTPMRFSEDFAYYCQKCPSGFIGIGNGINSSELHSSNYCFNDEIIETAINLFASLI